MDSPVSYYISTITASDVISTIYGVLSIIFFLIILRIIYRVVRGFIRLFTKTNSVLGQDVRIRLISLGVAVLLLPGALADFIRFLVTTINGVLIDTPQQLFDRWRAAGLSICDDPTLCIGQLGFGFVQTWVSVFSTAFERLLELSFTRLVLFIVIWVLTAYLLDQATLSQEEVTNKTKGLVWLQNWYNRLGPVGIRNIVFFFILGMAGYLSTAAIAAIPGLQEISTVTQEVSVNNLKLQLEGTFSQFSNKFPNDLSTVDPFAKLAPYAAASTNAITQTVSANSSGVNNAARIPSSGNQISATIASSQGTPINTTLITDTKTITSTSVITNQAIPAVVITQNVLKKYRQIEPVLNELHREREELHNRWKELVTNITSQQLTAKDAAIRVYEISNLDRKGNREQAQHFLLINNWYTQRSADFEAALNPCRASLENLDRSLLSFTDNVQQELADETSPYFYPDRNAFQIFDEPRKTCTDITLTTEVPERPALGSSYLGPFGVVASWLLKTESLPLALITGLLGFGLLGAACSTFIREQRTKRDVLIVQDLTGVIVRGVSAAIVVFLAVEGGLAIFAAGSSEPNPYVLLLTCFVAAVFSEKIWEWAQERVIGNFTGESGGKAKSRENTQVSDREATATNNKQTLHEHEMPKDSGQDLPLTASAKSQEEREIISEAPIVESSQSPTTAKPLGQPIRTATTTTRGSAKGEASRHRSLWSYARALLRRKPSR